MPRLIVELTNRCNLRCGHCYDERHAATGELSLELLRKILREGRACGVEHLSFTGGEPTLHSRFEEVVSETCAAGYTFGFVSNGSTLPKIYGLLLRYRAQFDGATFSLDGARQQTHDSLRGRGSYRQVMRAASVCVARGLPFIFNMVLTARNRGEVGELVSLAARLGSGAVRFGYLMPTPDTFARGLDLGPQERREAEAEIWSLQKSAPLTVTMAPGYFSENPFFPCGPLELREFNLDYRGNLTLCCQLSGYQGGTPATDFMGNLHEVSLAEAWGCFQQRVKLYLADKREKIARGDFTELDHFPCWYCVKYLDKAPRLGVLPQHSWASR